MRWFRIVVALGLIVCALPFVSLVTAGLIAQHYGCTLQENAIQPCVINGVDYGLTLQTMAMMGWLMIATLPIAAGLVVLWAVAELVWFWRKRRAQAVS